MLKFLAKLSTNVCYTSVQSASIYDKYSRVPTYIKFTPIATLEDTLGSAISLTVKTVVNTPATYVEEPGFDSRFLFWQRLPTLCCRATIFLVHSLLQFLEISSSRKMEVRDIEYTDFQKVRRKCKT